MDRENERSMDRDEFSGYWNEAKGKIKEKWGKLTDDDITRVNGERDQLLGVLQQRYGYEKSRAEEEVANWENEFSPEEEYSEEPISRK